MKLRVVALRQREQRVDAALLDQLDLGVHPGRLGLGLRLVGHLLAELQQRVAVLA